MNNRLGNELEMFERLFGISDKAIMAPGVLVGNKRPPARTISPYDMGLNFIQYFYVFEPVKSNKLRFFYDSAEKNLILFF